MYYALLVCTVSYGNDIAVYTVVLSHRPETEVKHHEIINDVFPQNTGEGVSFKGGSRQKQS